MSFLPVINDASELIDGNLFHLLPFCKSIPMHKKCKAHYEKMKSSPTGCYCCPFGMSSYVYRDPQRTIIFTGLRIRETYDKKKAKSIESDRNIYNPVVPLHVCETIASTELDIIFEKKKLEEKSQTIRDILHESRTLNGRIRESIDQLWESADQDEQLDYNDMIETITQVHVCSLMLATRFSRYDAVNNPSLSLGSPYNAVIFKKFDKLRRLMKNYQRKNVRIVINSPTQSDYKYPVYPTFELLLFILFENGIKYSPANETIDVQFEEKGSILTVRIKSIGPYSDENEILHICDKGFRGQNAMAIQKDGQGLGLSFAKEICASHKIDIDFNSLYYRKDHGIKYGFFTVILRFDNHQLNDN